MLEYKEVTLFLGGLLSVNILGALVYRPQDQKAVKRTAEDNSIESHQKADNRMAEDNSVETRSSMKKSMKMVMNPVLVTYYLNTNLWNASLVLLRVFLYSFITEVYFSTFWAGTALTLFGVGVLVMSVAMSVINSKVETNKYLVHLVSAIVMGCSTCGMGLIHNVYAIIALTCVYGGMFGVLLSNITSFVKHLNGTRAHNLIYAISQTLWRDWCSYSSAHSACNSTSAPSKLLVFRFHFIKFS